MVDPDSTNPDQQVCVQGLTLPFFRLKDLRSPAKKWKLEKNAQQLYMTGTVVLYQVVCGTGFGLGPDPDWVRFLIGSGSGIRIWIRAGSGLGLDTDWGRIRIRARSELKYRIHKDT
jgi:hypothetical protein